ncbi:ras-related protein Rab-38-like [Tigriopus californicus]|uniref:ras-related protein Rab-38-like n=1 Tax=Tigriopus californicus TaxID=6832 RepID=UPI0027DA2F41|nr:ras-related protein Rab-38-like [Tigriopus californicus]
MEVRRRPVSLHVDSDGMVNPSPRRIAFESPQFKNRQASQPSSLDLETMLKFRRRKGDRSSSRLYKVIVVGEVHCGKSAIIRRYVHNFFNDTYRSTVGVDFHLKIIPYNEELELRLQLWDIAGQERFSHMTRAYFKGAMGALVVFDLSNAQSFEAVAKWKGDIDKKCLLPDGRRIPTILIGNKRDVARDKCLPCDLTISEFATEKGFVPKWYKTSAKTGDGIEDALRILVKYIMAMDTWNRPLADPDEQDVFQPQKTIRLEEDMVDGNPTVPSSSSDRDQSTNVKGCACSLL